MKGVNIVWEEQKEIQRIHQEVLEAEAEKQYNKDIVNVGFKQEELKSLLSFMDFFAYD